MSQFPPSSYRAAASSERDRHLDEERRQGAAAYADLHARTDAARRKLDGGNDCFDTLEEAVDGTLTLIAELRAKLANWQPVETALKDGSHFLVTGLGARGFGICGGKWQDWCAVVHYWSNPGEEGFYLSSGGADTPAVTFTHWMPLPETGTVTAGCAAGDPK